jgi:two-component system response regulator (stage 0 sporulation protein A)
MDQRPLVLVATAFISNYVASSVARLGVKELTRKLCSIEKVLENLRRMVNGIVISFVHPHVEVLEAEQLVTEILHEITVPAHIKGYQYLREAILIAVKDMDVCNAMEKVLYPRVAKVFHTTPQRVIRAMRHAITVVWRKSNHAIIEKHCGYLGGKPNPSQFIEALAEDVQWQLDKDK